MNKKILYSGIIWGILSGFSLAWFVDFIFKSYPKDTPLALSQRSPLFFKNNQYANSAFDKQKSLLSQTETRLDTLIHLYSEMTPEELHREIIKIDSEKKSNPTGTLSDAVAIMYLAYCWGLQDTENAYQYYHSEYLANNRAMYSTSWDNLVVQAWADRDPITAYEYKCKIMDEIHKKKTQKKSTSESSENKLSSEADLFSPVKNPPILNESEQLREEQERQDIAAAADFESAMTRINLAMGKFSPNTAIQWALNSKFASVKEVIYSLAWNHPDKIPDVVKTISKLQKEFDIEDKMTLSQIWMKIDPQKANEWIQTFPLEDKLEIQDNQKYYNNIANLESAFAVFDSLDNEEKNYTKNEVISRFKDKEPEKILDWVQKQFLTKDITERDLQLLCSDLVPHEKKSALKYKEYLEKLAPSEFKSQMCKELLNTNPAIGYSLDDSVSLAKMAMNREEIDYEIIIYALNNRNWYYDSNQLSIWINALNLPQKDKEKLLKMSTFDISK